MNIDERLLSLTQSLELMKARHEALTESVELMAAMQKDGEKKMLQLAGIVTDIAEGTARLLHVVKGHEQRISHLEGDSPTM